MSAVLSSLFLAKEKFIQQEKLSNYDCKRYLEHKFAITNRLNLPTSLDENKICQTEKRQNIVYKIGNMVYQFACQKKDLFLGNKPTRKKYIAFTQLSDVLDLNQPAIALNYIDSLSELPISSEQEPKIVIVNKPIDDSLFRDFYGIVITNYHFDIKGNNKIYGVLYSSVDNQRKERNLVYKKSVIEALAAKYSSWNVLPSSRNFLHSE
ncbi:DUF2572 family protein [[Haemophilus] ducreyi]|nr:DUF2572 family protein [[Haemophilus] ducreyi]